METIVCLREVIKSWRCEVGVLTLTLGQNIPWLCVFWGVPPPLRASLLSLCMGEVNQVILYLVHSSA